LCNRMRFAFCVRCFVETAETWVNGIRKTCSTNCSDTRVGEWKIGVPMRQRSPRSVCFVISVCVLYIAERIAQWELCIVCCDCTMLYNVVMS
jgi:hypothetical protein